MSAPTVMTLVQLAAPVAAGGLVAALMLLARTVENGRESWASRTARRNQPGTKRL